ncbi:helix-turn-helix transcriptional regulator [Phenylobacterium sp.]|uniref:helix-turn-helix transcriptional regulator n=1 Tax=Phenylobacterium sp. TaxID=1871053 RepID=UPI00396CABDF
MAGRPFAPRLAAAGRRREGVTSSRPAGRSRQILARGAPVAARQATLIAPPEQRGNSPRNAVIACVRKPDRVGRSVVRRTGVMRALDEERSAASVGGDEFAPVTLSPRQIECLFWVQQGKSSRDIGTILGISHRMVERHVFRACRKLGVRTRIQAVIRARALGLIQDPAPRPVARAS